MPGHQTGRSMGWQLKTQHTSCPEDQGRSVQLLTAATALRYFLRSTTSGVSLAVAAVLANSAWGMEAGRWVSAAVGAGALERSSIEEAAQHQTHHHRCRAQGGAQLLGQKATPSHAKHQKLAGLTSYSTRMRAAGPFTDSSPSASATDLELLPSA